MNKEIADLWVAQLRLPDLRQGRARLFNGKGFCCLGVLCTTLGETFVQIPGMTGYGVEGSAPHPRDLERDWLPQATADRAGICDLKGRPRDGRVTISKRTFDSLWQANDAGVSFAEIADWIEGNWERL